eukprot:scaffold23195_cov51-Attheya_sp.AAC.2
MSSEGESGSKRAAPESVLSSSTNATPSSIGEIAPPPKKQATGEIVTSSSSPIVKAEAEAAVASSSATGIGDPAEVLLEWSDYKDGTKMNVSFPASKIIDEILTIPFADTRVVENEPCDHGDRHFTLKIADKTEGCNNSEGSKSISFIWWKESSNANLMNFNELSKSKERERYLGPKLWGAAGRKRNQYNGMAIEFGQSPHSRVEVNELLLDAFYPLCYDQEQITYISECDCTTNAQGLRLLNGLISLVGSKSNLLAHGSDLDRLNVRSEAVETLGFNLVKGRGSDWYARPGSDYS